MKEPIRIKYIGKIDQIKLRRLFEERENQIKKQHGDFLCVITTPHDGIVELSSGDIPLPAIPEIQKALAGSVNLAKI